MPWAGVSLRLNSAATRPRHAGPFLPSVEQHGPRAAAGTFPRVTTCLMGTVPPGHTHTACYVLQLQGTGHKLAGCARPPHWATLGPVGDQAQALEHSSEQGDTCSCKGSPEEQGRAPRAAPAQTPHLSQPAPSLGPQPALRLARCLEAIQDPCLVSMATLAEITLKRNETSSFSGWQAGGREAGLGKEGKLGANGQWCR